MTNLRNTGLMPLITEVLGNAPECVRHDLAVRDRTVRVRAEETLAAMISAALTTIERSEPQPVTVAISTPLHSDAII